MYWIAIKYIIYMKKIYTVFVLMLGIYKVDDVGMYINRFQRVCWIIIICCLESLGLHPSFTIVHTENNIIKRKRLFTERLGIGQRNKICSP